MSDTNNPFADQLSEMTQNISKMVEQNQSLMTDMFNQSHLLASNSVDPMNVGPAFTNAAKIMISNPQQLMESNYSLWKDHMAMWQEVAARDATQNLNDSDAKQEPYDRRFRHEDWSKNPIFDYIRKSYLITSKWLVETMSKVEGLSENERNKVIFHTKLLADSFSPNNFLMTNPDALRTMMDTNGQSVINGMQNLVRDLDPATGQLNIMMSDPDAFKLGVDIATTPGKIVYQNDLVQLIQYEPTTPKVYKRPLVIVPPWINKYYILDLQKQNSFVAWAVAQGYSVFIVSWVNPDSKLGDKKFEDYMQEGILDVLDAVELACGQPDVTMIGYCIGGTLLSATLAYLVDKGDRRVKAATFFASQADFSEAGELKIFTDEAQVDNLERMMSEKGYLEGSAMASTFNMLRANDLIWAFYIDNYLLGKEPLKFDLLYWNADSTRIPREAHLYYLREMYIKNNLSTPGGISLKGVPIDLSKITIPIYLQAAKEDHIAPYQSVFKSTGLFSGPVRFVLAGSVHIAGVINPPAANKYNHWINEEQPKNLDTWLETAEEHAGSWWNDWDNWLKKHSGAKVGARVPGDADLDVIEDAPGTYVSIKS
jgi:polyhydroxyalkanoate synthase